jgi:hypothetical protein
LLVRCDGSSDEPAFVVGLSSGRVFLIDSTERCATVEGIGPGVTLGRAQQIYGAGKTDPTDSGYFVWFPPRGQIEFLLDQRDIPKELRDIPDDVFSADNERAILGLSQARVSAVRVNAQ